MNHLHWPKVLGHSDDAIADFTRCVELQAETERRPRPAYHLRTHVALGDACVKDEQYTAARQAWTRGLELFPDDAALVKRLGIEDDESLLEFVLAERSLEGGIDTNLSFVDRIP
ncbi:MAG: hypothetical protein GY842_20745 [bacterium]|nr:hypothetical protein [bacterium]